MNRKRRTFAISIRSLCSAPVAGIVLAANSLFGLFRYRQLEPFWIGLMFLLIGLNRLVEA
jgi:hypothetical protein